MKNKYKFMWLFVMFDLPTKTKVNRRNAQLFRDVLLKNGFNMMQYSIYYKACNTLENVNVFKKRIKSNIPEKGFVNLLYITDIQFSNMEMLNRNKLIKNKEFPKQLTFF